MFYLYVQSLKERQDQIETYSILRHFKPWDVKIMIHSDACPRM